MTPIGTPINKLLQQGETAKRVKVKKGQDPADAFIESLSPETTARLAHDLGMLFVDQDPAHVLVTESAMIDWWGERCPDYEPGCFVCEAWKAFDSTTRD